MSKALKISKQAHRIIMAELLQPQSIKIPETVKNANFSLKTSQLEIYTEISQIKEFLKEIGANLCLKTILRMADENIKEREILKSKQI